MPSSGADHGAAQRSAGAARRISSRLGHRLEIGGRGDPLVAARDPGCSMISARPNSAHGERHEVDAVVELGHAEGEARVAPLLTSVPTRPTQQAEHDHADRLDHRAVREHDRGDQAEQHQREIFRRAELARANAASGGANAAMRMVADAAGEERADGGDARARRRRALAAPSDSRRCRSPPRTTRPAG